MFYSLLRAAQSPRSASISSPTGAEWPEAKFDLGSSFKVKNTSEGAEAEAPKFEFGAKVRGVERARDGKRETFCLGGAHDRAGERASERGQTKGDARPVER